MRVIGIFTTEQSGAYIISTFRVQQRLCSSSPTAQQFISATSRLEAFALLLGSTVPTVKHNVSSKQLGKQHCAICALESLSLSFRSALCHLHTNGPSSTFSDYGSRPTKIYLITTSRHHVRNCCQRCPPATSTACV